MQELSQAELVIQKHRGKWTVRQVGYDPSTGKRRVRQVGTFETRKSATAYKDRVADGRIGTDTDTVAGYVGESWLAAVEPRVDESTFDQYSWAVGSHIVPLLGEVKLKDLTPELLDRWIRELCLPDEDGNTRLGLTSTRTVRKVLSMALADGVTRGHLARNPVVATKPPRAKRAPKRKGWTFDEAKVFIEATRGHRLFVAFHLGLVTGLRRGEILGLDWDQVDLESGNLEIAQQYVIVKGRPVLKPVPKTEASDRIVAIGSRTIELLDSLQKKERIFLLFYAVMSILMLVGGVTAGLLFLTRWAERTFAFFNGFASLFLASGVVIMVIISGVAYVQSLTKAEFLRS